MGHLLGSRPLSCEFFRIQRAPLNLTFSQGQYVDGLRAPLVIHPPTEVYSYDEEFTVILGDWYHEQHSVLLKQFINIADPAGAEPVPGRHYDYYYLGHHSPDNLDAGLIYFAQNASYLGPTAGTSTSGSTVGFNENATLPFEPGKTYRLRVINTSAFSGFYFWIDGHDMRIIEADGVSPKYLDIPYLLELILFFVD